MYYTSQHLKISRRGRIGLSPTELRFNLVKGNYVEGVLPEEIPLALNELLNGIRMLPIQFATKILLFHFDVSSSAELL